MITENDRNFVSQIYEKLFTTFRFPTSEQIARTNNVLITQEMIPMIVDGIKAGDEYWIKEAKKIILRTGGRLDFESIYGPLEEVE